MLEQIRDGRWIEFSAVVHCAADCVCIGLYPGQTHWGVKIELRGVEKPIYVKCDSENDAKAYRDELAIKVKTAKGEPVDEPIDVDSHSISTATIPPRRSSFWKTMPSGHLWASDPLDRRYVHYRYL